ncbi:MAG: flagellar filament capping protein FliD [Nitrososphaerales archaeon]
MPGNISLSGLISDINWTKLIDDLVNAKKASAVTPYENSKAKYGRKLEAYRELNRKISDIVSLIKELRLNTENGYRVLTYEIKSNDPGLNPDTSISVSVSENSYPGTYTIGILSLAKKEKIASDSLSSVADPLGLTGTFVINGKEIQIAETDSLADLKDKINLATCGVTASILKISDNEMRLILESQNEGSSGISISDPDNILESIGVLDSDKNKKNVITQGQDSLLKIDGFYVSSQTNTISDVIPGVTLRLKSETQNSSLTLTIKNDEETQLRNIGELVKRINSLISFIDTQNSYSPENPRPLHGDVTLQNIKNGVASVKYLTWEQNSTYKNLSSIGIEFTREGVLKLDETKLAYALSNSKDEVTAILKGFSDNLLERLNLLIDPYTGSLKKIESSIESQISRIDSRLKEIEKRFEREKEILEKKYSELELLISKSNLIKSWMESQIKAMFKKD